MGKIEGMCGDNFKYFVNNTTSQTQFNQSMYICRPFMRPGAEI